jgi:putative methionine-R-sulfoxide reductase with GAF domain
MDRYSILDQSSPLPGQRVRPEPDVATPSPWDAKETVRFPGEDGGKSLAETVRGDFHAALQLLAERAQYITGALAATIGLYQDGELICYACTGLAKQKAGERIEIGSGLAEESIRTRRILRCNDTMADPRVNPEICRKFGISSAMVMPLVRGQHVIGVFELFSGHTGAFEEKDLTALERLGEMVETAVEQSEPATETPQETFFEEELPLPEVETVPLQLDPNATVIVAAGAEKTTVDDGPLLERGTIGNCNKCDFPISGYRRLCVDCEASNPPEAQMPVAEPTAPAFLSGGQNEAAKPARRGSAAYTIGAVLVAVFTGLLLAGMRYPGLLDWVMQNVKLPH